MIMCHNQKSGEKEFGKKNSAEGQNAGTKSTASSNNNIRTKKNLKQKWPPPLAIRRPLTRRKRREGSDMPAFILRLSLLQLSLFFLGLFAAGQDNVDSSLAFLKASIPGEPGLDYPILWDVYMDTAFSCRGKLFGGYYADPETRCQCYHICLNLKEDFPRKTTFLCPNGTIFDQQRLICDWWFNVDCDRAESLYQLNENLIGFASFNSDGVNASKQKKRRISMAEDERNRYKRKSSTSTKKSKTAKTTSDDASISESSSSSSRGRGGGLTKKNSKHRSAKGNSKNYQYANGSESKNAIEEDRRRSSKSFKEEIRDRKRWTKRWRSLNYKRKKKRRGKKKMSRKKIDTQEI